MQRGSLQNRPVCPHKLETAYDSATGLLSECPFPIEEHLEVVVPRPPSKTIVLTISRGLFHRFFETARSVTALGGVALTVACGSTSGPVSEPADAATLPTDSGGASEATTPSNDASHNDVPPEGGATPACPPDQPAGASCTVSCTAAQVGANCSYGAECCVCGSESPYWMCVPANLPSPCPASPATAGSACHADASCTYCLETGLVIVDCAVGSAGTGQWNVAVGPGNPGNGCTLPGGP